MAAAVDLLALKHAEELRGMWQGRVLSATRLEPLGSVLLSVLAHNFTENDAWIVLLHACTGTARVEAPFICSTAKVDKTGAVVADMVFPDDPLPRRDVVIFKSEIRMRDVFRQLADRLKLDDDDRLQLFAAVHNWCAADRRLDPTMDPKDPDAKRLVH